MYKIGKYASLKPCHWFWEKIKTGYRNCYKGVYGIESERCMQCTPDYPFCTQSCVFCWRDIEKGTLLEMEDYDDPKLLVDAFIEKQLEIVGSLNVKNYLKNVDVALKVYDKFKGREVSVDDILEIVSKKKLQLILNLLKTEKTGSKVKIPDEFDYEKTKENITKAFENAKKPKHVAISLDGEPTLYPCLGDLIEEFKKRGFTTFVVTNGTKPERIEELNRNNQLPTQLYVTLAAPNKEIYKKVCRPLISDGWERLMKTLYMLKDLDCRTVIRITSVKNLNMVYPEQYEEIVEKSSPWFLEIKGFTMESHAKQIFERVGYKFDDPIPTHDDILNFASKFKFEKIYDNKDSRFALLKVNPKGDVRIHGL
jgi:wyosine [tRNA(Phe)-imidazoG37] synthetase (radical SAM superfamily)